MPSDWLMADHAPPGTDLRDADAEMVVVTLGAGGEAVMLEVAGHTFVFRGDELRAKLTPEQRAEAA